MTITKKDCLEFLRTHKVNGEKNEHVYGLFVLVEKLKGAWPSYNDVFLNGDFPQLSARAENRILKSVEGFTPREFGCMVWAKNEIKRRDDAIKEWEKSNPMYMYDHISTMQALSRSPNLRSRCARVPIITSPEQESGSSNDIPKRPFLNNAQQVLCNKALAQKVGGGRVAGGDIFNNTVKTIKVGMESINSPTWVGVDWSEIEKEYKASKLKAEQEAKQMKERDSNAELKEGDKAIVSNEQGFVMSYGAELIGHEVEIVKFFSHVNIDLAAVNFNGSVYCFRKSMLEPVKTERQKAVEFYMGKVSDGMVKSVYKANEKYYGFAVESLIDNGYLNTKIPPVAR